MLRKIGVTIGAGLAIITAACAASQAQVSASAGGDAAAISDHQQMIATPVAAETDAYGALGYPLVDTNQRYCYSDTASIPCPAEGQADFGQDRQYLSNPPQYVDNGDGTITDEVTGLMWVKEAGDKISYRQAVDGADGFTLAGYEDWRVPSIKELYSLMDYSGVDPSSMEVVSPLVTPFINTDFFDFEYGDPADGSRVIDSQWVTSSIYESTVFNRQQCFFGVNFADGRIKCYPTADNGRNAGFFVRYVRGNSSYGHNQFVDNGNGTIQDKATGLTWMQADSGQAMDWGQALAYCESLDVAGQTDWRLPNIKELQSLVDYSRSPDNTDSPAIDSMFSSTAITNEAGQMDWPYMWSSTTHTNERGFENAAYISFGRALGYMQQLGGWLDVHGAGAQRSDPKTGSPDDYPTGMGPQGDARRSQNYARCVRGGLSGEVFIGGEADTRAVNNTVQPQQQGPAGELPARSQGNTPPQPAITACVDLSAGDACSFTTPNGTHSGTCGQTSGGLACVP